MLPLNRSRFIPLFTAASLAVAGTAFTQIQDSPSINPSEILSTLKQLRDAQVAQVKAARQNAMQQASAGAASGERAAAMWEEAVRATQFEGAARENTAFREWKEKEGEGLKGKEAQNAARLFFVWLGLTLQRSNGTPVKDLLPQVINFTKEIALDQQAAEALGESVQKEKERDGNKRGPVIGRGVEHAAVKKMHDQILSKPLAASPVVQALKIADLLKSENWEQHPANIDGIYNKIILPELRAQKDIRVLEYWDLKLKKEGELASAKRVEFEITKFNTVRRPQLLFNRAEEMLYLGLKNRAIGEMLNLVKSFPSHTDATAWMNRLEELLAPATNLPSTSTTLPAPAP